MGVWVELTEVQMQDMQLEIDKTLAAGRDGSPGILLAQIKIADEKMKVMFIEHEKGLKMQDLINGKSGKTTSA